MSESHCQRVKKARLAPPAPAKRQRLSAPITKLHAATTTTSPGTPREAASPDVVFYHAAHKWLFLVDAATSHGPDSPTSFVDFEVMPAKRPARAVYVRASPHFGEFPKRNIDGETEISLCDISDRTIHYNGDAPLVQDDRYESPNAMHHRHRLPSVVINASLPFPMNYVPRKACSAPQHVCRS